MLLAVAGTVLGTAYFTDLVPGSSQPAPAVVDAQPATVVGLGYVEPSSGIIEVGAPGSPEATRISAIKVAEGDFVVAGQILAVLDSAPKIEAQIKATEAQIKLKKLLLDRQRLEVRSGLVASRAALDRARASLSAEEAELRRQEILFKKGYVTRSTIEKRRRDFATAQATVSEMEAARERREAKAGPGYASDGTIDVAVSEQELAVAVADLAVQNANLDLAMVRAPTDGRVLSIDAQPGELVGSDGLLELGDTRRMRAVVEVYQSDAASIRVGQSVELSARVLDRPIKGTVERIAAAIKRQTVINNEPAATTDARVVEVIVGLDEAASIAVSSLSRLQVEARFQP